MVTWKLRSKRLVRRIRQARSRKNGGSLYRQRPARGKETLSDPNRETTKSETNCRDLPLTAQGTPIGPNDLMIASIARAHGLTLVTHNTREFSRVPGLKLEDWQ